MSEQISITVNGTKDSALANTSILTYVSNHDYDVHSLVVEHNYKILTKAQWEHAILQDGDILLIFKFIGGG